MEAPIFIRLVTILCLSAAWAQDVQEPPPIITTENFEFPAFETTEKPSEAAVLGAATATEELRPPAPVEGKEEEPHAVVEQPVVVAFPDNHKNFTSSQYLGEEDYPPYRDHLSSYQQQYKHYNEQKQLYNRKPIKFEENSLKNYYLPSGADAPRFGEEKKKEDSRVNRNPFPYAFENERPPEQQSNWFHAASHPLAQERPPQEHAFRGHQESGLPYYVFPHAQPHGYPQGEAFYEDEVTYHDRHQHHVKKEEKGSPWRKVLHVLTALVPLGLLLATLTPNVISINSTTSAKATRKTSEDPSPFQFEEEDVLRLMKKYGVESLTEMQCEDRVICELAREGGKTTAEPIEKGFWLLANRTPWDVAEKAGMNELFKAIKTGNCEAYKCHSKKRSHGKSGFGKTMKKHKTEKQ